MVGELLDLPDYERDARYLKGIRSYLIGTSGRRVASKWLDGWRILPINCRVTEYRQVVESYQILICVGRVPGGFPVIPLIFFH